MEKEQNCEPPEEKEPEECGSVPAKKHDLSLNLEMPLKGAAGGLFADQTPTPTRLIGKCEEVGLFEDLQKVNPFDETFRRAVESRTSVTPSEELVPTVSALAVPNRIAEGETLHTPHIFPSNIDRTDDSLVSNNGQAEGQQAGTAAKAQRSKCKQSPSSRTKLPADGKRVPSKSTPVKRKAPALVDILPKPSPSPQLAPVACETTIPVIIIPSTTTPAEQDAPGCSVPVADISPLQVKEKLKEHLKKPRNKGPTARSEDKRSEGGTKRSSNERQGVGNAPPKTSKEELPESTDSKPDTLKQERWKAAAKRYRIRRKEDQDKLHQRSMELEQENIRLRTELTKLRHAHRHCSVTQQMNLAATLAAQSSAGGEPVILNATGPNQQPFLLTSPQQRLITSHIVNSHTMNTKPIFIVIGAGATSTEQDGTVPS
ncbi:cyclic AMP-dependent transcription factor ATF-2 [Anopheles aquasalis]|uniref:cyclic AMP-dependent transcription factor ATF-2 n=1 Tax=Anopheles aquasalis TaxID=42839 RepID=UPI00215AACF8|nr:cyclic AMP-dependent transcription factor ATF-2 [Anopheles aquasalis]